MDNIINELLPDKLSETGAGLPPGQQNEIFDRDASVYVMPAHFLADSQSSPNAKRFGLLILVGGFFLLAIFSVLAYYFLFKQKSIQSSLPAPAVEESSLTTEPPPAAPAIAPSDQSVPDGILATIGPETLSQEEVVNITEEGATGESTTTAADMATAADDILDADEDGLSDQEEVIFNTNPALSDTDGDAYSDGQEVSNLYNPGGNGKIGENPGLIFYRATSFDYGFFYPGGWELSRIDGDNSLIITAPDKQFLQIVLQPNSGRLAIDEWYRDQFTVDTISADLFYARDGWDGLFLEDKLTLYLTDKNREYLVAIAYNPNNTAHHFKNIYQLAINSFIFGDASGN